VPSAAPGKAAHVTAGVGASATSPKPAAASSASHEPGFLTFDTYPWTRVTENGKLLGTTPLVKVALAPGVHVLTFENEEQAVSHTQSVTIKSGEVTVGRLGLK
jgi:serine/threonine-protein kinase